MYPKRQATIQTTKTFGFRSGNMKKIDKLLLASFAGPFVASFGVALFVLVMQVLWLHIDDIAGKGVGLFIMLELIGYLSIAVFPMALPIAVLLASVMVMGNLAERYELSSMKSAGISLLRVMRSIIITAAGIACFSYLCSDFFIPVANLKFKSRLHDIQRQKPALALEEGVFSEEFRQFVIRIGKKARDGETISDVMIEDQTSAGKLKLNQILADSGQMFTTNDNRFFVMNLYDGAQYQEPTQTRPASGGYPFVRTKFKIWTKVWDLSEFDMVRTPEGRFKNINGALTIGQLKKNMDSLQLEMYSSKQFIADDLIARIKRRPPQSNPPKPVAQSGTTLNRALLESTFPPLPVQRWSGNISAFGSILETFEPKSREKLRKDAIVQAKTGITALDRRKAYIESRRKEAVKTGFQYYTKYTFILLCLLFSFIGVPLGAIIRKGGFGYPVLVSITFFVAFIMLTALCQKLAEAYIVTPFWAAAAPCVFLIFIGTYLTRSAMNDSL
jgi:lipopolysaccharide export system permease protein